ncbi:MAG: STAS domain-containing protein [Chloroflexota bacterium]
MINNAALMNDTLSTELMDLNIETSKGITIVQVIGELDAVTAPVFQEQVLPLADQQPKILLDMSRVTYLSSAGLRILLLLYRKLSENVGQIVIAGLNDDVRDVMAITGFLDFFHIVETRNDGIKALRQPKTHA